jgi:KipI family sensor histidine kinase inhibitor
MPDHGGMHREETAPGPVLRVLRYGDRALLVEAAEDAVGGIRAALEQSPLPGQVDLVAAAVTVLVVLDRPPAETDLARLFRLTPVRAADDEAGTVTLDVVFDGPDLADVARLTGRSAAALVEELTAVELSVAFTGFAPGFGYLTGLPADLHVPRRDTPRTRVPAGSLGLAGPYAGIYPRASPGGWQLIGRTDAILFDVERDPPALLRPGTRVRFRDAGRPC